MFCKLISSISHFQRPESPTLPPEVSIQNNGNSGVTSETSSTYSTTNNNDPTREMTLNLSKSPYGNMRSRDIGPISPTSGKLTYLIS